MEITEYLGLQFFEGAYLVVLAILPFIVVQKFIVIFLAALVTLYGLLTVIKRGRAKLIGITGQGVFITGCDTGFGQCLAERLDSLGFTVYAGCLDITGEGAETLKGSKTGRMHVVPLDVTSDESVNDCLAEVMKLCEGKGLWAVVNNAGVYCIGPAELCTIDMYKRTAEINQWGVVRVTRSFLPLVRSQKGRIVNVASVKGRMTTKLSAAYCMTKYAIEAFSDVLRLEMLEFGVKVVIIEPSKFGGATAIHNDDQVEKVQKDNDRMWEEANQDVKGAYDKKRLDDIITGLKDNKKNSSSTMSPVIDAMEDAIVNVDPQYRYLIHGGRSWLDSFCVLAWLNPFLPERWMDFIKLRVEN